jgi:hypothetical protein
MLVVTFVKNMFSFHLTSPLWHLLIGVCILTIIICKLFLLLSFHRLLLTTPNQVNLQILNKIQLLMMQTVQEMMR